MNARDYKIILTQTHEELDGMSLLEFYAGRIFHFYGDTLDGIADGYIDEISAEQVRWNDCGHGFDITFDGSLLAIRQAADGTLHANTYKTAC